MAWLRWVERRWNWELNCFHACGYSGTDGGYEYRLPQVKP
jgi:hypothetical protein